MRAEEVAQKLKAHVALAEDASSVPSTHMAGWLTITVIPTPRGT